MWVTEDNILLPLQPPLDAKSEVYTKTIAIESKGMHSIRQLLKNEVLHFVRVSFFLIPMPYPPFLSSPLPNRGPALALL